jgi:hypothetical protein
MRGRRPGSDQDAGRRDLGILRTHKPAGTGLAGLLVGVGRTRTVGRVYSTWVPMSGRAVIHDVEDAGDGLIRFLTVELLG